MLRFYLLTVFLVFYLTPLHAQVDSTENQHSKKAPKVKFTPLPYINYSESQKFQYGLIGMATFNTKQNDTISPQSVAGASYIRTTRGSWFGNIFGKFYFKEDQWRLSTMIGTGNYNFQTFIDGNDIPQGFYDYSSETTIASLRAFRKIHKKNFLGLGYFYNEAQTTFEDFGAESTLTSQAIQFIYLNDSRDNVYFPRKGIRAIVMYTAYPDWLGNDDNFGVFNGYVNKYISPKENQVWAFRAMAKVGSKDLAFQRQVVFSGIDLRGYTNGKYRGDGKMNIQAEYRYNFNPKIGLVAFGGLGTLFGSDNEDFNGKIYPSIGAGFRLLAVKSTGMRFGMDFARGKEEWAFYFRLGESF